jgi:hypothetical protein
MSQHRRVKVVQVAVLVIGACVLSVSHAAAQIRGAVVGGVSSASLSLPEIPLELIDFGGFDFTTGRRTTFIGGVIIDFPASRIAAFETGALFSDKGASFKVTVPDLGAANGQFRFRYLDVPLLAKFGVGQFTGGRVYLLAGGTLGLKLGANVKVSAAGVSDTIDFDDEVPSTDFGLTFAGRVERGKALGEVRYTHGLQDLADGGDIRNRVISFLAGWRF